MDDIKLELRNLLEIKTGRRQKFTVSEMANKIGVEKETLYTWLSPQGRNPPKWAIKLVKIELGM